MTLISQAQAASGTIPAADVPPLPEVTINPPTMDTATVAPGANADMAAATGPGTGESLAFNIGFILLLFIMFYVLMIRPQQKRMKAQQEMIGGLTKGDRVVTNGGILGTIEKINDAEVELEISPGVKVTVLRYSVYKKYDPADYAPAKKSA